MNNTIYITFGVVFAIYVGFRITNRKRSSDRKSRTFMEDYNRKNKDSE